VTIRLIDKTEKVGFSKVLRSYVGQFFGGNSSGLANDITLNRSVRNPAFHRIADLIAVTTPLQCDEQIPETYWMPGALAISLVVPNRDRFQ
jgi:hypothetical protein